MAGWFAISKAVLTLGALARCRSTIFTGHYVNTLTTHARIRAWAVQGTSVPGLGRKTFVMQLRDYLLCVTKSLRDLNLRMTTSFSYFLRVLQHFAYV